MTTGILWRIFVFYIKVHKFYMGGVGRKWGIINILHELEKQIWTSKR